MLYPLKFHPLFKERIWGGDKLKSVLNKEYKGLPNCGESWEISGLPDNSTEVCSGALAGNTLEELVSVYLGSLVGDRVYEKFGNNFPLLIKFIDAQADLSVQVHPSDEFALSEEHSLGKTEMWYVLQAEPGAKLVSGFKKSVSPEQVAHHLECGTLEQILHTVSVTAGDVFFLPAGRVHAIGAGILLAEIQQSSDITYRVYDYNRTDAQGKQRELHVEKALKVLDYEYREDIKTDYSIVANRPALLASCPYFQTSILELTSPYDKDIYSLDSFVIYICLEGSGMVCWEGNTYPLTQGETMLIPASLLNYSIKPQDSMTLIETHIPG